IIKKNKKTKNKKKKNVGKCLIKEAFKSASGRSINVLKITTAIPAITPAKRALLRRHIRSRKKKLGIPKLIRKFSLKGYNFNSPAQGTNIDILININKIYYVIWINWINLFFI